MNGLSKITDKIINEARAEAAERLASADARAAEIRREYEARAAEIEREISARSKAEAEELVERARSGEENMQRNIMLEAEAELIDKAFMRARREILEMPEPEYLEFMSSLLAATFCYRLFEEKQNIELYGDEGREEVECYEVLINAKDRERIGDRLLASAKSRLAGNDAQALAEMAVLSEENVNIDGGLILRCGSMEINNSVRSIFGEIRPRVESDVRKALFSELPERKKG